MRLSKTERKAKSKKASKKAKVFSVIFVLLLCISVGLALYPTISKKVNTAFANSTVDNYSMDVASMSDSRIDEMLHEAEQYNAELAKMVRADGTPDFDYKENYYDILSVNDKGIIGSVEIPAINVRLPIYHGTEDEFLNDGAGHLIGTSFPVGGKNTHAAISAHTAFPGKLFFDRLTEVKEGDIFYVTVLTRRLEYKVTDIQIVLPSDGQALGFDKGRDLVTLITCTPYSINTHRLLVTGERVETTDSLTDTDKELNDTEETSTAEEGALSESEHKTDRITAFVWIGIAAFAIFAVVIIAVIVIKRQRKSDEEKEDSE